MSTEMKKSDPDWWRGAVIYQVYIRSFCDSDGDGIGDLQGITGKLEHIASLGVDALWITPFFPSPMKDFGYDVSDYCNVDPIFGTLEDFDKLVARSHKLGLRVIIDQVISHSSDQHPWFTESRRSRDNPKADWYVWAEPGPHGGVPNNWLSVFGGSAWQWHEARQQYYLHNFLAEQPDLNFHNKAVRAAMLETMDFWLQRGVDGFRLDTVNFYFHDQVLRDNPPAKAEARNNLGTDVNPYHDQEHLFDKNQKENIAFLEELRSLMDRYPGTTTMGEVGDASMGGAIIADYTTGHKRLHMCYDCEFLGGHLRAEYFSGQVQDFELKGKGGWQCWAFSNHDVRRHLSCWSSPEMTQQERAKLAKLLVGLLLSFRGSACLYQGEELGLTEAELQFEQLKDPYGIQFWPEFKGRDGCRTPMPWNDEGKGAGFTTGEPWLPIPPEHLSLAANRQTKDPNSIYSQYKRFIHWYRSHPVLAKGSILIIDSRHPVLAFEREYKNEKILAIFNLRASQAAYDLYANHAVQALTGHGYNSRLEGNRVHLPGYGAFFGLIS